MSDRPGTTCYRIREVLRDGPAMTGEVACALGISVRLAAAHLENQKDRGRVTKSRFPTKTGSVRNLWSIAE